jgi:hypothetical protein
MQGKSSAMDVNWLSAIISLQQASMDMDKPHFFVYSC